MITDVPKSKFRLSANYWLRLVWALRLQACSELMWLVCSWWHFAFCCIYCCKGKSTNSCLQYLPDNVALCAVCICFSECSRRGPTWSRWPGRKTPTWRKEKSANRHGVIWLLGGEQICTDCDACLFNSERFVVSDCLPKHLHNHDKSVVLGSCARLRQYLWDYGTDYALKRFR